MPIVPSQDSIDSDGGTLFGTEITLRRSPPAAEPPKAYRRAPPGPNAVMSEADELLGLVPQLRSTAQIADLGQLRARIAALLEQFDERMRKRRVVPGQAQKAHFVLCALIDEVVESMPWGAGGRWERLNPLKAAAGASAGATVRMFAQLAEDRTSSRDLRELVYVALALGFDARGRGAAAGGVDADQIRSRLAQALKRKSEPGTQALSVRWQPAVGRGSAFGSWLPLWVGTFVVAALLAALYFSLSLALGSQSDRVFAQIAALRLPVPATATASAAPPASPRLVPLLGAAVSPSVQVRDEMDRSVITLSDQLLFEPGTANLLGAGADALRPVAAALRDTAGRVLVVGHTDHEFEPSAMFPSNWELSVERARAVHDALLLDGVPESRMRYDGRADTEPLAAAGTSQAPVHSGRVEIVLLAGR
jgi:type VI secretion system protein ImpK